MIYIRGQKEDFHLWREMGDPRSPQKKFTVALTVLTWVNDQQTASRYSPYSLEVFL